MINLIVKWSEMISEEVGRKKFLKEQQVRWHPDKFLQKCGNRLYTGDKERIIEQVKKLSQEINSLLDWNIIQENNKSIKTLWEFEGGQY